MKLGRTYAAIALVWALSVPAWAQEDDALMTFSALKPEIALQLAQGAMTSCRDGGYQIAVAVVDRTGEPQVILRDRFAGPHTIDTAIRKAWTAVSFRIDTLSLDEEISAGNLSQGLRSITHALPLGGGVPVESAGSIVAGIGISGAPDPAIDDECARAGIEAIIDAIGF